jgi:hypothetical protein
MMNCKRSIIPEGRNAWLAGYSMDIGREKHRTRVEKTRENTMCT